MNRNASSLFLLACALVGCRGAPTAPAETKLHLVVYGDSVIYTTAGAQTEPLRVAVLDASTGAPVSGVAVTWQSTPAATLGQSQSTSDAGGLVVTFVSPPVDGVYRVQATTARLQGPAPVIEVRAVPRPVISSVQPASIAAGAEVTITGNHFRPVAADNAVYFDNVRGHVLAATTTSLRVRVPQCLPSRMAQVVAGLGAVTSAAVSVQVSGTSGAAISLAPGGVRTLSAAEDLSCIRLPGGEANAIWMLVVHNAGDRAAPPVQFELRALQPQPSAAATAIRAEPLRPAFAYEWEAALRRSERALGPVQHAPAGDDVAARPAALPTVGSRREFNVYGNDQKFRKVTATARVVGVRGIVYVDNEAEAAFDEEDLQFFARTFDDPIFSTVAGVYGDPSDLDGNSRVVILFTPQVNLLTPRRATSFISGFFYGCDLVSRSRCSGTNQGEIFYALVPDPTGRWGDARTRFAVREAVPPVLAHEFQHMIHFARRGFSSDALWLSEGLAHTAEELVADVLQSRGETSLARTFRSGNHTRAQQYLAAIDRTALIDDELPGTIELRGAAWLFLRYLRAHHAGDALLRRLTASTRSSVANVTHETGRAWRELSTSYAVALWASDLPELAGRIEPQFTFNGFSPRSTLSSVPGSYPLRPALMPWRDFTVAGTMPTGSNGYYNLPVTGGSSAPPLTLVLSGHRGATPPAPLAISLIRIR
jgi:hypothetical protein